MLAAMDRTLERVERWERRTAGTLTGLAVLFIVVYAVPILRPAMPADWRTACEVANVVIWVLFAVDYIVRLRLSPDRLRFLRSNLFDLAVLALPALRPLRMLRLVTALLVLNRRTERWTRGRLALYVGASTAMLVLVAGLAVLDAERGSPDGSIDTYVEALWWAVVTITTVGYGDLYPTTVPGRLVALGLMIGGIGLIGFVTGSLASWIVERVSAAAERPPESTEATKADVAALMTELHELRAELAEIREAGPAVPRPRELTDQ
jgi:voltage-gated potassium channel